MKMIKMNDLLSYNNKRREQPLSPPRMKFLRNIYIRQPNHSQPLPTKLLPLRLRLDIRNARQFEGAFVQNRLVNGLKAVVWVIFPIPFGHIGTCVLCVRPVCCAYEAIKRVLLPQKVLLCGIGDRHVTGVDAEPWLVCLRAEVVVWCPRVPDEKVTWLGADFLPLATFLFEPLYSILGKAVPFRSPGWNSLLVDELLVEFLRQKMAASAHNQSTVICSIWQQVHKTLQAPESWLRWILILMRPGRVWWNIFAAET